MGATQTDRFADRFVRLPTELLETMLYSKLTGVEARILLWVIRNTYGWNRKATSYSWYQIAKDLSLDRGGVVRAGNTLLRARALCTGQGRLGIQEDYGQWALLAAKSDDAGQLWMPGISADKRHRKPMTASIACDDGGHRNRCQESSVFRRAKDRCKDKLKTYIKTGAANDVALQRFRNGAFNEHQHRAGAARPVPGKYDGLSQD
jgi:phage replication O-like protein O